MKAIFWNIGKVYSEGKLALITEAIHTEKPDIFCIAEGTPKMEECKILVEEFKKLGYNCYYSPLFSKEQRLGYDYEEFGLKIFIRPEVRI